MFSDNLNVDPAVTAGIKNSAMLLPFLGAPLALGALAGIVIGGLGLGAAATATAAAAIGGPITGDLIPSPKQLLEKIVSASQNFTSDNPPTSS